MKLETAIIILSDEKNRYAVCFDPLRSSFARRVTVLQDGKEIKRHHTVLQPTIVNAKKLIENATK